MKRLGRLAALLTAVAMGFTAPATIAPRATADSAEVTPRNKDQAPVATQAPAAPIVQMQRRVTGGLESFRPDGFIWQGQAKRGNRRGRSRWNYNR